MSRNHGFYAALFAVTLLVQALPNAADAAAVPNGDITALRAAITNAAPGGTIVLFKKGTYILDGTQLVIDKQITINGQGATIDGNDASGVINVISTGNLTLRDVIITGGFAENGGGIYNSYGTVTLKDKSSVSGNTASAGGGIYNLQVGTVTLKDNSSVSNNTADKGNGGGILNYRGMGNYGACTVTLSDKSSVSGNTADRYGGGIYNDEYATVTLSDKSSVTNNTAGDGGGIYNGGTLNNANAGGNVRNNQPNQIYSNR